LLQSLFLALAMASFGSATSFGQGPGGSAERSPGNQISVSYFYEGLSPDGEWFQDPSYGWCWTPYEVSSEWRPYSDGHWEYSDYGWTWATEETWGWATYHYGRWFFDDSYGWAWVPGSEWAPAWVAWRSGDDWVGWAPLPPTARWDASAGLAFTNLDRIPSQEWTFVPREHVTDVNLRLEIGSIARNVTLIGRTRDATRLEVRSGRPANLGIDIAQVEGAVGRPVPRVRIVDVDTPRGSGRPASGGTIGVFRPAVRPPGADQAPAPSVVRRDDAPAPGQLVQRQERQRRLESDLDTQRTRLAREQADELRTQAAGPRAEEVRKNQAAEQAAFAAHAAQQRQVLAKRTQKQVEKPQKAEVRKPDARPDPRDKGAREDKRDR
jgi:hypothetical protein